jgi:hypothetical protein
MKCDHYATVKCPEIKLNKDIKEIKQHTRTPSKFFGFVEGHSS